MQHPKFAFYVHHHGSGHLMRAISIASRLRNAEIFFLGSDLMRFNHLIPDHIKCFHLPTDVAGPQDVHARLQQLSFLHYAPLNTKRAVNRVSMISSILDSLFPAVFIVDVSVEVTVLAALCGIPTVVIRQNGQRTDPAHLLAYESAQLLIAPSPKNLMDESGLPWVEQKTFYSGGFCKNLSPNNSGFDIDKDTVAVIVGSGGTSIDGTFIAALALQCRNKTIHILGRVDLDGICIPENIKYYGLVGDPEEVISKCEVVIGNAGHNTVMEMAHLKKKFICIPESRPFQEQICKADLLNANGMAVVVDSCKIMGADWNGLLKQAQNLSDNCWDGVINLNALEEISDVLHSLWQDHFTDL